MATQTFEVNLKVVVSIDPSDLETVSELRQALAANAVDVLQRWAPEWPDDYILEEWEEVASLIGSYHLVEETHE